MNPEQSPSVAPALATPPLNPVAEVATTMQPMSVMPQPQPDVVAAAPVIPIAATPGNDLHAQIKQYLNTETIGHWLFRLGFASIFLVNAIYAAMEPADFSRMLTKNVIAGGIGFTDPMIKFAMVNDALLGVLILGGWRKKMVYAWAGAWLLLVAGLKLMNYIVVRG